MKCNFAFSDKTVSDILKTIPNPMYNIIDALFKQNKMFITLFLQNIEIKYQVDSNV